HGPGKADARRKVILICLEAAARDAVSADANKSSGRDVVNIRAIFGIDRRRVVFVTQTTGKREPFMDAKTVVNKKVVTVGANPLWVIDTRHARQKWKAEQKIGERVAGDLAKRRELEPPARLNIAESVLLREAQVSAKFDQMPAVNVTGVIDELVNVRDTVLRIVTFVTER